jgi:hypothetical protein
MRQLGSPDSEQLPDWARKVIARGATAYAVASTTASAISLGHLASAAGHDPFRSVLFAVSFECAATITGTAWVAGRRGGWWFTTGRAATLGLLAASLVFNAAEVLQVQHMLPAGVLLGVAVALVFPIGALLFTHLALMVKQGARPAVDGAARGQRLRPARRIPGVGGKDDQAVRGNGDARGGRHSVAWGAVCYDSAAVALHDRVGKCVVVVAV